jgi:nucleoside 2-deoxyribosyltransferase
MLMKKIYLASPYGFTDSGLYFMNEVMIPMLKKENFEVLNPWGMLPEFKKELAAAFSIKDPTDMQNKIEEILSSVAGKDLKLVDECDFLLAVLDGSDVDSGVALEIGYAYVKGKKMIGYRSDTRQSGDMPPLKVNVMIGDCIRNSGGKVFAGSGSWEELKKSISTIFN